MIYLQTCGTCELDGIDVDDCKECGLNEDTTTWCIDRIYPSDKVYFSEKAVMSAMEKMLKKVVAHTKKYAGPGFTLNYNLIYDAIKSLKEGK